MELLNFEQLRETVYHQELSNGLKIYVLNKKGYQRHYATFTTKYGSIDSRFIVNGKEYYVPDGIAHFLEHKMFEKKEGDVFNTFAINGAQTNAFTSFDRTAYLFTSTENLNTNLETLLNFVQEPYFTDESVEKEKGIISQEIRMYDDDPDWRSYFGLIQALYHEHPVKIDIAGTVESISKITKEDLYNCYNTFYHPSNMIFFLVSDNDPKKAIELIETNQSKKTFGTIPSIERIYPSEPREAKDKEKVIELPVSIPKVLIGFKENRLGLTGKEFIKIEQSSRILLEVILGKGSDLYERLLEQGLINEDFSSDYQSENSYAFSLFGGTSKNPESLIAILNEEIYNLKKNGIDQNAFLRVKRRKIGDFLRKLNSPEFIANQFTRYIFNDANLFDILSVTEQLESTDVNERLEHFDPAVMGISIVKPPN